MAGPLPTGAYLGGALARQGATLRAELQNAATEMTTGIREDAGKAVRGDFGALASIDHALARLAGQAAVTAETALTAAAMQGALTVIGDGASGLATNLMRDTGLAVPEELAAVAQDATRRFETAIAALNTRVADRAVFGGTLPETAPLPDAGTLLAALDAATAGAATVEDVVTAVSDWFDDPAGYAAHYAGGGARGPLPVAAGETVSLPVTALDPAIRETLKGLATAALLDRGLFANQPEARAGVARAAGEMLLASADDRAVLAARVGTVEAQVEAAQSRNAGESAALDLARAGIVAADPYETAARLQDVEARLESLYVLTARLSGLSLTGYLR